MKFELEEASVELNGLPVIKVIGLGGGGSNALDYMVHNQIEGVEFIAANTDAQALNKSLAAQRVQLGKSGLGAGSNTEKGKQAAMEDIDTIKGELEGTQMLFVTAGMGGGTGTGSAPVVAKAAREMGILTVGVVTRPYAFENRDKAAEAGIEELSHHVDSLIVIPNEKLKKTAGKNFSIRKAFDMANEVLHSAVQGVAEIITKPGFINVDFEDVRTVMGSRGMAMMGVGLASGDDRAREAAMKAISNPLLEDISIQGARGILVNVAGNDELGLEEYEAVGELVKQFAHPEAMVKVGLSFDDELNDAVRVTIIATGLAVAEQSRAEVKPTAAVTAAPTAAPEPAPRTAPAPTGNRYANLGTPTGRVPGSVQPAAAAGGVVGLRQSQPGVIGSTARANDGYGYLDVAAWVRRQAD